MGRISIAAASTKERRTRRAERPFMRGVHLRRLRRSAVSTLR